MPKPMAPRPTNPTAGLDIVRNLMLELCRKIEERATISKKRQEQVLRVGVKRGLSGEGSAWDVRRKSECLPVRTEWWEDVDSHCGIAGAPRKRCGFKVRLQQSTNINAMIRINLTGRTKKQGRITVKHHLKF